MTTTVRRRSRAAIDRRYMFADILMRTGKAMLLLIALIAIGTPFTLRGAIDAGLTEYVVIMAAYGAFGVAILLLGRRVRRSATHWDVD